MPSPFPGMNPYLEHHHFWADFHATFIPALREALTAQVAPDYFVAVEEHVYIHESNDDRRLIGTPDIDVTFPNPPKKAAKPGSVATLPAPATVSIPRFRKRKVGFLQVVDSRDQKVVTVIELLSPSNKYAGEDRESYLTKRRELLASRVSLIELDFLRGGPRMPLKDLPACDYYALVSRPSARPKADIWPIGLRDPLPTLPIPLREGGAEATVDLQAVLHRVYDGAGYASQIYRYDPEPKLAPTDAEWARQLIATAPA